MEALIDLIRLADKRPSLVSPIAWIGGTRRRRRCGHNGRTYDLPPFASKNTS
jgi:hypothetical protein